MAFKAQFVGICACGCGEYINREDLINWVNDVEGYVLEGHERQARTDRNAICTKCHLQHAGECF